MAYRKVLSDTKDNINGIIKKVFTHDLSNARVIYSRYYQYEIVSLFYNGESNKESSVEFTSRGYFLLLSDSTSSLPNEFTIDNITREFKQSISKVFKDDNQSTHFIEISSMLHDNLFKGHSVIKTKFTSNYKINEITKEVIMENFHFNKTQIEKVFEKIL